MSFIFNEIMESMGWFDAGPFTSFANVNYLHHINSPVSITQDTVIGYFPGCFAEFHDGHISVINKFIKQMQGRDYVVVIAPANSDYTAEKYGNVLHATNHYRFNKIVEKLNGVQGNIIIDLNPMLNHDRDYNFTDLIQNFIIRQGFEYDKMPVPYVICGKDRQYFSTMLQHTARINVFYGDDDTGLSSSLLIKQDPKPIKKKILWLRCCNVRQFSLFVKYFGHHYESVNYVNIESEMITAINMVDGDTSALTICKDYAHIFQYVPLHRKYKHPLDPSPTHECDDRVFLFAGKTIIDSDIFTGGTAKYVQQFHGHIRAVHNFSNKVDEFELLDYYDFVTGAYAYPHVDLTSRCSMMPFTKAEHHNFNEFLIQSKELEKEYENQ